MWNFNNLGGLCSAKCRTCPPYEDQHSFGRENAQRPQLAIERPGKTIRAVKEVGYVGGAANCGKVHEGFSKPSLLRTKP